MSELVVAGRDGRVVVGLGERGRNITHFALGCIEKEEE